MKKILTFTSCLIIGTALFAQQDTLTTAEPQSDPILVQKITDLEDGLKSLKNLAVTGYVQTQFQFGEKDASLKVGGANTDKTKSFNRIGIRRGRIKFTYTRGIGSGVFQFDFTDKGLGFKDVFLKLTDPWINSISTTVGVFDRPFGYEISYSSSLRESPERSTVFQTLFPDERDLGAKLTLQAPKTSPWNILKLDAGFFAGNSINIETDNRKDFIGHLAINQSSNAYFKWGAGASYYNGGVYQGSKNIYKSNENGFSVDSSVSNIGQFAKREYVGFDVQLNFISKMGLTKLSSEYLFGTQPGGSKNSKSPNTATLPTSDVYVRSFSGGYAMLVQDLGPLPVSAIVKYDWYNPNTKVKGNNIGTNKTNAGDIAYNTIGLGLQWKIINGFRLTAYYEMVKNETSANLSGYDTDRKDNVLTVRLQYKF
ncbi:MAG: hypothetical protein KF882_06765 [Bacteroidia bacterium]|nr:hypothetical protein [Bacteroidia bacterium]MCO5253495.1 hypothetical protein [Bacteroidota bacterium]